MVETVEAVSNLDDILSVPGVDAVYVGPSDLSVSLGLHPGNNDGEPSFDAAVAKILDGCARHNVIAGCHTVSELCQRRAAQGFRMITITLRHRGAHKGCSRTSCTGPAAQEPTVRSASMY